MPPHETIYATPARPSPYNNQAMQTTTGYKDIFVPVFNSTDESMFCLSITDNSMAPVFSKGDYLIISPEKWTRSGDLAAIEYGDDKPAKMIAQVTYMDEFVVLESVNHKRAPIAITRGKDSFRVIGRVVSRYQKFE